MGSHHTSVVPTETREFYGACTCRWVTMRHYPTAQQAEDETIKHLALVEKVRAYTRRSQPSLRESRDHYREQAILAEQQHNDEDAALWWMLAREIDHRLNDTAPQHEGQAQLW